MLHLPDSHIKSKDKNLIQRDQVDRTFNIGLVILQKNPIVIPRGSL